MKKFVVIGGKWFDKVNGNTYHTAKIIDTETGTIYYNRFQYGYGTHYLTTAREYIEGDLGVKDFEIINGGELYGRKSDIKNGRF